MDIQLEEEIYTNGRGQGGGCTTIQRCGNCNKPRHNVYICKKDKEMSNVYSSE